MTAGDLTSPPASRPAHRPRSQAVRTLSSLRKGVLGGACVYGRKPRSPPYGAGGRRRGVVPTRRAGAPPAGPPTATYGQPADDACVGVTNFSVFSTIQGNTMAKLFQALLLRGYTIAIIPHMHLSLGPAPDSNCSQTDDHAKS